MNLTYRHLSEQDMQDICAWRYEGDYALYNLPDYHEMKQRQMGFFNPARHKNFYGFWEENQLVGFVNILEEETQVFLGIGVDPAYCGRHYGQTILAAAYAISKELYPEKPLYLEVRSWNRRAIACYEKAGFTIDGDAFTQTTGIGSGTFYRMVRV